MKIIAYREGGSAIGQENDSLFLLDLDNNSTEIISSQTMQNLFSRGYWTDQIPSDIQENLDSAFSKTLKGGPNSGNFHHEGRPGEVGGSSTNSITGVDPENQNHKDFKAAVEQVKGIMLSILAPGQEEALKKEFETHSKEILDKAQIFIRATPSVLNKILKDGRIKSQYETFTSSGYFSQSSRALFEEKMFGIEYGEPYSESATAHIHRPIYGYLGEKNPLFDASDLSQYGNVAIELKDTVKKRTYFTGWDSLTANRGGYIPQVLPSPVTSPNWLSWDVDVRRYKSVNDAAYKGMNDSGNYVEAQVLGGVKVSDIKNVWFSGNPNSKVVLKFEERLKKSGIGIKKAKTGIQL